MYGCLTNEETLHFRTNSTSPVHMSRWSGDRTRIADSSRRVKCRWAPEDERLSCYFISSCPPDLFLSHSLPLLHLKHKRAFYWGNGAGRRKKKTKTIHPPPGMETRTWRIFILSQEIILHVEAAHIIYVFGSLYQDAQSAKNPNLSTSKTAKFPMGQICRAPHHFVRSQNGILLESPQSGENCGERFPVDSVACPGLGLTQAAANNRWN